MFLRALLRLITFLPLTSLYATGCILVYALNRSKPEVIDPIFRTWARHMMPLLGIKLELRGAFPAERTLIMPNHRSYVDVVPFPAITFVTFVGKIEVSRWPIIGFCCQAVHTVFVDRKDPDSRKKTRIEIKRRLDDGYSILVYPEGTTAQAPEIKPFRPGMFHVAADGGIPIVPVAMEYAYARDAFVGEDKFLPHFFRTFGKRHTPLRVSIGPPMRDADGDRLRENVEAWVRSEAESLRAGFMRDQTPTSQPQ
jgi:1-acyl-sn-glycerol-3-phosphate acyltransferase